MNPKTYLIILNTPICKTEPSIFTNLWNSSTIRICADGGSNRLYDFNSDFKPDFIKGDLDSIEESVKDYYSGLGVKICLDRDQDSTDLGKCLALVQEIEREREGDELVWVLIHGGIGGRLDQTIHTLHTLLKLELEPINRNEKMTKDNEEEVIKRSYERQVWVVDSFSKNLTFVINKEFQHELMIEKSWKRESELTCGILPIGVNEAIVTTKGLRWDLDDTITSMTGLLSTSNQVAKCTEVIEIETNENIIWTMEIPKESKDF
ncbi:uncharacterized protein MELLADRAFT_92108 [Melampsora larici-populina 98AG31]|uniref:Thiamine pyrophosphokinase n=1 Tax=Melampsora larici-populina (strain 98AG31 / pathotype 3-4-7) TaxID=747676 RepID=F4S1I9_MELLP|nr:uncharacterized protein MELLADRAFT_92108 [Melampsora larici-populina 98AG31]EGG01497.1 hypothetical protein MELLADRAFT_92108 [Melampsora larici-populina 98AG31]